MEVIFLIADLAYPPLQEINGIFWASINDHVNQLLRAHLFCMKFNF